jgi:hypothetical protein
VLNQDAKMVLRVSVEVVWRRGGASREAESASAQPILL